jgi:chemotaxis protein MotA
MKLVKSLLKVLMGGGVSKGAYIELLSLIYELGQTIKKDGILGLESHMENPYNSSILSKYPIFFQNHHAVDFLADTVRIIIRVVPQLKTR